MPCAMAMLLCLLPAKAVAHPHMFLDSVVTFEIDDTGLKGFWFEWTFDQMFSAMIVMDIDRNGDKTFNVAEMKRVEGEAFSNIRNYGYFTYVTWRGKETRPDVAEQFHASIVDDRLVYRFFIPFRVQLAPGAQDSLSVAVYDETFFCDCRHAPESPVRVKGSTAVSTSFRIQQDGGAGIRYSTTDGNASTNLGTQDKTRYTGLFRPTRIVLDLRRAK